MYKGDDKKKAFEWQKKNTTMYTLRFMNTTGVPDAVKRATTKTGEATASYLKAAIIQRLQNDGFLEDGDIILNLNTHKHRQKLERLEKYLEEEKKKMK